MAGALFESYCLQETVKNFANMGEQPRISYLRTNNGLEVDLIIEGPNMRPLPVEIKLSRTPTAVLASGLTRYASLFEKELNRRMVFCSVWPTASAQFVVE